MAYSAKVLVDSASRVGDRLRIGQFAIGFLLLSIITSLPEMLVAIFSVNKGVVGITLGDIFGSNVVNISFVTGLTLLIGRKKVTSVPLRDLAGVLYFSSLIPIILSIFKVWSRIAGLVLIAFFVLFSYLSIIKGQRLASSEKSSVKLRRDIIIIAMGAVGIVVGARLAVDTAASLADLLGVTQLAIGAKIVSVGTSLPELVVALQAARLGRYQMSLGTSVGSNLTNMTLILGTVFLLAPIQVNVQSLQLATTFVLIVTSTFWYFISRGTLGRIEGSILLAQYSLFLLIL
ncbi:MAG: sodium:calcium antiporter [Thaumarchaeota archaeon]|nr:sodium:calcium antiporter [Nitrososphaerota archaeon]